MRFTGICLITQRVRVLADFYAKVLGVEALGDDSHVEMSVPGAGLAIFSIEGMEAMAAGSTRGIGYGGVTLMLEVADADVEAERLQALGVELVKPPQTHPWGSRSVWFRDLDGNLVDFYCPAPPA